MESLKFFHWNLINLSLSYICWKENVNKPSYSLYRHRVPSCPATPSPIKFLNFHYIFYSNFSIEISYINLALSCFCWKEHVNNPSHPLYPHRVPSCPATPSPKRGTCGCWTCRPSPTSPPTSRCCWRSTRTPATPGRTWCWPWVSAIL